MRTRCGVCVRARAAGLPGLLVLIVCVVLWVGEERWLVSFVRHRGRGGGKEREDEDG